MKRWFALLATVGFMLGGCGGGIASKPVADDDFSVSGPRSFGAADNVMRIRNLHISRQPDKSGFAKAADSGITVVIDTRVPGELRWDEKAAVQGEGMSYYNVPIARKGDSLDGDALARITAIVEQHRDAQILMHCGSGNRVSAWLATHLVEDHGLEEERAIGIARETGLTSSGLEKRVRTYLGERDAPN